MRRMTAAAILTAALAAASAAPSGRAAAQTASITPAQPFAFEQFPAGERYAGRPTRPNIATSPNEANFIGYMEQAQARSGVNFAGAYTIATWPCLSMCVSVVAIDARTGAIVRAPEAYNGLAFRSDSRLLVINPPQNLPGPSVPAELRPEYYEFTGTAFRRLDNPAINTPGTFSPQAGVPLPPLPVPNAPPPPNAAPGWGTGAYGSTIAPDAPDFPGRPPLPPPVPPPGVGAGALPVPAQPLPPETVIRMPAR
jgi:hypothetical protein